MHARAGARAQGRNGLPAAVGFLKGPPGDSAYPGVRGVPPQPVAALPRLPPGPFSRPGPLRVGRVNRVVRGLTAAAGLWALGRSPVQHRAAGLAQPGLPCPPCPGCFPGRGKPHHLVPNLPLGLPNRAEEKYSFNFPE